MKTTWSTPELSNAVRLSGRQWLAVAAFAVVLVVAAPVVWARFERFDPATDYRIPYELNNDYWLYSRYAGIAAARHPGVVIGDSVVWGPYVRADETLSHALNAIEGSERFANLGLDGAEPVALRGLVEHYAHAVRGKDVILQCNPLWLSSPQRDLRTDDEQRLSHPRLVPQFVPSIPSYREGYSGRIGIAVEQRVPFLAWTSHLQQAYYDRMNIPSWTLDHPDANPAAPLFAGLPQTPGEPHESPIPWTKRKIKPQDFPWVDLTTSVQWASFLQTVDLLKARGNHVHVLVGPLNEHMLTEESRGRYAGVKRTIVAGLKARNVPVLAPVALPSDEYGDASHPLAPGYARLAKEVAPFLEARGN